MMATALCCLSSGAMAETAITVADVVRLAADNEIFKVHISGAGRGLEVANGLLRHRGQRQIYCQPDMALTDDQYLRLMRNHLELAPKDGELEARLFAVVLGMALEETFPCR